ncbi:MAG TPA: histidine kinase [Puia sp.]|nr:histidine kinase [Puia sp.]
MRHKYNTLVKLQWLIWSVLTVMFFFYTLEIDPVSYAFDYAIHSTLSYAFIVYANALWLMPRLYRKKKYIAYTLSILFMLVAVTYLRVTSQVYIWFHYIIQKPLLLEFRSYVYTFIINSLFFVFSIAFRFTLDFFQIKQQQQKLLKEHAQAQLSLLKAQVQPHFLFNTLNNIYFVAQRESPITADLIEKLSSIMRYFLEQGPKQEIALTAELDFIRNYIELEKMRMRYPVKTDIELPEDLSLIRIPPMLLIPLVENVFKHGIDKREENNYISIRLQLSDRLDFSVCNRICKDQDPGSHGNGVGVGIGLTNLSQRLSILYGANFALNSHRSEDTYTSKLNIPL